MESTSSGLLGRRLRVRGFARAAGDRFTHQFVLVCLESLDHRFRAKLWTALNGAE